MVVVVNLDSEFFETSHISSICKQQRKDDGNVSFDAFCRIDAVTAFRSNCAGVGSGGSCDSPFISDR